MSESEKWINSESGYVQQVKARAQLGVQVRVKVGDYAERESEYG